MEKEKSEKSEIIGIDVLDLTNETHGSAIGIGLAYLTTEKLLNKNNL